MKRFLLFLSVVFAIGIVAKADEVTVTYSALNLTSGASLVDKPTIVNDANGDKIATITYFKNDGASNPQYNSSDKALRFYGHTGTARNGNSMTITGEEGISLVKIVFTTKTTWATSEGYASVGTFNGGTWTKPETQDVTAVTIQNKATAQ